MRGNSRWYGSPTWAVLLMVVLMASLASPVTLANVDTTGEEPATVEDELPEAMDDVPPAVQPEDDSEVPPVVEPTVSVQQPQTGSDTPATEPDAPAQSEDDTDVAPEDTPDDESLATEPADEPGVDPGDNADDPEPTVATLEPTADFPDQKQEPGSGMMLLAAPSDIGVSLSASVAEMSPGGTVSYTVTVANNGEEIADLVSFDVVLEWVSVTGWAFSYVSSSPGVQRASCNDPVVGVTTVFDCEIEVLQPGMSATFGLLSHTSAVDLEAYCDVALSGTVQVTSVDGARGETGAGPVFTTVRCEDEPEAEPEPASDIVLSLSGPAEIALGEELSYTTTIQNDGDATADEVRYSLVIPIDTGQKWDHEVLSDSSGYLNCAFNPGGPGFACTVLEMEPGDVVTIVSRSSSELLSEAACGETHSLQARSGWVDGVTWPARYSNSVETTITCDDGTVDATISLVGPLETALGGMLGYTMTVEYTGAATANWIQFQLAPVLDTGMPWAPVVVTGHGDVLNCSYDHALALAYCNALNVEPGDVMVVAVSSSTHLVSEDQCGTTIAQQAQIHSVDDEALPDAMSNTVESLLVCDGALAEDITIALSGPSEVRRGDTYTYEMTIANTGSVAAGAIRTSATLQNTGSPWTGTLASSTSGHASLPGAGGECQFAGVSLACTILELAPGEAVTIAMSSPTGSLDDVFCATTRNQDASVTWVDGQVPGATSNLVATEIDCGAEPDDMGIALTGDTLVTQGDTVSYTMTVTNHGDELANEVRFNTAGLPSTGSAWTWSFAAPVVPGPLDGCNHIPSLPPLVACAFHGIAPGESVAVTVESSTTLLDETACGTTWEQVTAVVWVDGQVISDTWSNAVMTEFVCSGPEDPSGNLTIEKAGPASIERGDSLVYTVTVTNTGSTVIEGVRVADTWLPLTTGHDWTVETSGLVTGGCSLPASTNMLNCFNLTLPAGESLVVMMTSAGTDPDATVCEVQNNAHISSVEGVVLQSAIFSNMVYTSFEGCGDPGPTATATVPATPTQTATSTVPATSTATATTPATSTATPSATSTPTATVPATPTATTTQPATPVQTATATATATSSPSATTTVSPTAVPTGTSPVDPTVTATTLPDDGEGTPGGTPPGTGDEPDEDGPGDVPSQPSTPAEGSTTPSDPLDDSGDSTMQPSAASGPDGATPNQGEEVNPVTAFPVTGQGSAKAKPPYAAILVLAAMLLATAGQGVRRSSRS